MNDRPNCYACRHREQLPGDCHSKCVHPEADLIGMVAILATGEAHFKTGLQVAGNRNAILSGYFMWPMNYDPLWLERCSGFEEKTDG